MIDATHDASLRCWVPAADAHPQFPIQNLPLGVFAPSGERPRGGMAIGDSIIDLAGLAAANLLGGDAKIAATACGTTLNALLALGTRYRRALRGAVSALLSDGAAKARAQVHVHAAHDCTLYAPADIGDYTDFYAGIHHALAVGKLFRPDAPLLPNYKHVPIAYHGRSSSIRVSGTQVPRPRGQIKAADAAAPAYVPTARLDFELELGIWVGPGSELSGPVSVAQAHEHIAGYCLLNDWSARDIQAWEYQPLGPFLAKNFLTTISPWIVTPEALAPYRIPQPTRPAGDPRPLPYLWDDADQANGALDIDLAVSLRTAAMRHAGLAPERITASNTRHLYWTAAQMLAHHTSGGCNLRAGDLFGSGTISSPESGGSLLELSGGGAQPVQFSTGEQRTFLLDGDEVLLSATAHRPGLAPIGFGECRGIVVAT